MVISVARQSVILKCEHRQSALLGNYEFYYLAGLLKKLYGLNLDADMDPEELHGKILAQLDGLSPKDEKEAYLIQMVRFFKPLAVHDEQTKELFRWGETEDRMWQL